MPHASLKTKVYIQQFIGECMPIFPIYALMFVGRSSLSTASITILFAWWVLVALLAEVPTGIIADKFSRKNALFYSYILQAAGFIAWLFVPTFLGYAVGFLLWGIGYAFQSGTFQAYLYQELKTTGEQSRFNKIYARCMSMNFLGMVSAYLLATLIGGSSYVTLLVISIALSLLAAFVTLSFPYKSKLDEGANAADGYLYMLRGAVKEIKHSRQALVYVVGLGVAMGLAGIVSEYVPLFYSYVGFTDRIVPILLAIGLTLSAAIGWYAHHLEKLVFWKVAALVIAGGSLLLAATSGGKWLGLVGMMSYMRLILLTETLLNASLQHAVQDKRRATVGSVAAFGSEVLGVVVLAGAAGLSFGLGDKAMYQGIALLTIVAGVVMIVFARRQRVSMVTVKTDDEAVLLPGRPI